MCLYIFGVCQVTYTQLRGWEGERDLSHFNVVAISITPDFKFFLNIV